MKLTNIIGEIQGSEMYTITQNGLDMLKGRELFDEGLEMMNLKEEVYSALDEYWNTNLADNIALEESYMGIINILRHIRSITKNPRIPKHLLINKLEELGYDEFEAIEVIDTLIESGLLQKLS
jgi:hypothetical protein